MDRCPVAIEVGVSRGYECESRSVEDTQESQSDSCTYSKTISIHSAILEEVRDVLLLSRALSRH